MASKQKIIEEYERERAQKLSRKMSQLGSSTSRRKKAACRRNLRKALRALRLKRKKAA